MKNYIFVLLVVFSVGWVGGAADAAIIVGRISHTEGQIYRYMDVDESWVEISQQSPAGTEDILLTGDDSRAEITFPNNMLIRMDEDTEIEIKNLDEEVGGFFLHNGLARFYNRGVGDELTVETVRGTLKVRPDSVIDVQADRQTVTITSVDGEAAFYSYNNEERVDVISGTSSLAFRQNSTVASGNPISLDWDRWCADREGVWDENRLTRSEHLPESMQEYAYAMEPYGHWQRVYYRGYYYWAWSPYSITVDWSPYTSGYWYDWHGSPVWIDENPWGWVTHHYGYWIDLQGIWMWTPYVHVSHVPGVTVIGFDIIFGKRFRPHWHPGRVRWITHNDYIGWLPLAPWETYYGHRKWGPRSVFVRGGFDFKIGLSNLRHIDHTVIIPKRFLYDRKHEAHGGYDRVRIHNVRRTAILKDYRPIAYSEKVRPGKHAAEMGKVENTRPRFEKRREAERARVKKSVTSVYKEGRAATDGFSKTEENNRVEKQQNSRRLVETEKKVVTVVNESEKIRQRNERNSIVRSRVQNRRESVDRNKRTSAGSRLSGRDDRQNETVTVEKRTGRIKVRQQVGIKGRMSRNVRQANRTVAARKDDRRDEKSDSRLLPKKQAPQQSRESRTENPNKKKYEAKKETEEERSARLAENNSNYTRKRNVFGSKRESGNGARRNANSFSGRRIR